MADAVFFSGYRVTRDGASIWPSRKLRHHWERLAAIKTTIDPVRWTCATELIFRNRPGLLFTSSRMVIFGQGIGRHCDALALICAAAPADAEIDAKSREIVQWGTTAVARRIARPAALGLAVDDQVVAARHYWARLDERRALRTLERLQAGRPDNVEAIRLQSEILRESGAPLAGVIAALERWHRLAPGDQTGAERLAGAYLAGNDARGVGVAQRVLAADPTHRETVDGLADYYLRQGDVSAAQAVWEEFGRRSTDPAERHDSQQALDYLGRWSRSPAFRARERARKAILLALPWLVVLTIVGAQAFSVYKKAQRSKRVERQVREFEQERRDRVEKMVRTPDAVTGWVIGSMAQVRAEAEKGNSAAQFTLGNWLIMGYRGPAAPAEGVAWLERAAAQGNANAWRELGQIYAAGKIVTKDEAKALDCYRRGADLGSPRAALEVGERYLQGRGVAQDPAEAVRYYRKGADGKNVWAQARLGRCYEKGLGVEADMATALTFYRAAAEKKNAWAAQRLAAFYGDKSSPSHNEAESWRWVQVAAEEGPPALQRYVANTLLTGRVTPRDPAAARRWFERAAKGRDAAAVYALAEFAWNGIGEPRDAGRAFARWTEAAGLGHPEALNRKATCQILGLGTKQDFAGARETVRQVVAWNANEAALLTELIQSVEAWQARPVVVRAGTHIPEPQVQPRPFYPFWRRVENVSGEATVDFHVNEQGRVKNAVVVSATHPDFGAAAIRTVEQWLFAPGTKDGRATSTYMQVPVVFTLDDERPVDAADPKIGPP